MLRTAYYYAGIIHPGLSPDQIAKSTDTKLLG